nr:ribosomal protein L3 [uncultured bacterium]
MGMGQVFSENGKLTPVTYVKCEPSVVCGIKTAEKDEYDAVVLGFENLGTRATKTRKFRVVKEFKGDVSSVEIGSPVDVSLFSEGEKVTMIGVSKGKGFQGRVRRHGMHVARKSHGTKYIRHGSTGSIGITARVQKGIRMPGRMGCDQVTLHKREIIKVDATRNFVAIKGPVPGAINSVVFLKKSA